MDGPNFEIERHDQVLKGLGRKPVEPSPNVSCLLQRRLVVKVSAAATARGGTSNLASLQDHIEITMF
jgi:hypothetical protein